MAKCFWELNAGDKFVVINDEVFAGITFIKCESGVSIDDGMTEVNAVDIISGDLWTIGDFFDVEPIEYNHK